MMKPPRRSIDCYLVFVTYHAVTRYVQRILGVGEITAGCKSPEGTAVEHCKAVGMTLEDVRRAILIPKVTFAIENRFSGIDTKKFTALISPIDATVVSIVPPPQLGGLSYEVRRRVQARRIAQHMNRITSGRSLNERRCESLPVQRQCANG